MAKVGRPRKKRKYVKSGLYSKKHSAPGGCCGKHPVLDDMARIEDLVHMPPEALERVLHRANRASCIRRVTKELLVAEPFVDCPRCGGLHAEVTFWPFENPVVAGHQRFTHYGKCPTNGQPIMLDSRYADVRN